MIHSQSPPNWMLTEIRRQLSHSDGQYAAQLLWSRGIQTPQQLKGFLHSDHYQPASPFEFGLEMERAVERIQQAYQRREKVFIWGDFDADGVTATAVLWEGLGQIFTQNCNLFYYIPNRFTESHGLNCAGIDQLVQQGCNLIITCDTGSTNLIEIEYANRLGIDVIITDHHTLLSERPPVVAIINPRHLPLDHPLYHLSGVAVAYKLIEALYECYPNLFQNPIETLLDLVAIGLIADLVQLTGDCRYFAQKGIQKLQKQQKNPTRPGVAKLLEFCKRTGDRPTDISFGLGPRINAVSRIHGDARFCVELLTSRDQKQSHKLALETELANTRRKALQKEVAQDVAQKLAKQDLSTTAVIILTDPQWSVGVLGLVAAQIAQNQQKPTILLTTESNDQSIQFARGSARSVQNIDLYKLVKSQAHLLERFGGHPFAAGLSLKAENLPLFIEGINRQMRQTLEGIEVAETNIIQAADIECTVTDLGYELFQELKLLEPCGMGNPTPKILIRDCYFTNVWHKNQQDLRGQKQSYIKTSFQIWDNSVSTGFPGVWWEHYKDEISERKQYHALVELDFNTYDKQYEIRLIELVESEEKNMELVPDSTPKTTQILDWRFEHQIELNHSDIVLQENPQSWQELQSGLKQAISAQKKFAIATSQPSHDSSLEVWQTLVGIAKYLSRTQQSLPRQKLIKKLNIGESSLEIGLDCLQNIGFQITQSQQNLQINQPLQIQNYSNSAIQPFLSAVEEEQFRRQYFAEVSLEIIQNIVRQY